LFVALCNDINVYDREGGQIPADSIRGKE